MRERPEEFARHLSDRIDKRLAEAINARESRRPAFSKEVVCFVLGVAVSAAFVGVARVMGWF